jgi:hypothetical protein
MRISFFRRDWRPGRSSSVAVSSSTPTLVGPLSFALLLLTSFFPAVASNNLAAMKGESMSKEKYGADNIVVKAPPFILGISVHTPFRRQLGILADNIVANKLESIVAYAIRTEMSTIYPKTFQDIDIEAELIAETEEREITRLTYLCDSHFVFLDTKKRLPSSAELRSIAIEALDDNLLSDAFRSSDDLVISSWKEAFVSRPDETRPHTKPSADDALASIMPPMYTVESSPPTVLALAGAGLILFAVLFRSIQKSNEKVILHNMQETNEKKCTDKPSSMPKYIYCASGGEDTGDISVGDTNSIFWLPVSSRRV